MNYELVRDVKKANRVIASCLSKNNVTIAKKMVENLHRKHKKYHDIKWVMDNFKEVLAAIDENVMIRKLL